MRVVLSAIDAVDEALHFPRILDELVRLLFDVWHVEMAVLFDFPLEGIYAGHKLPASPDLAHVI